MTPSFALALSFAVALSFVVAFLSVIPAGNLLLAFAVVLASEIGPGFRPGITTPQRSGL
jgi:hypothetical protein